MKPEQNFTKYVVWVVDQENIRNGWFIVQIYKADLKDTAEQLNL